MTDAINNNSRIRTSTPAIDNKNQTASQPTAQQSAGNNSSTVVDIKSTKLLETMATEIEKVPDIDHAKVDSIKSAIANGDYQANPEVIAQKFIEIEKLL